LISLAMVTGLFALIFKYVPDVEIDWDDVWIGAGMTALLFTIGKSLLGLYLGKASIGSSYGAAGSLVVLVVWVYYSAQILFLGAEFTQVQARQRGRVIRPSKRAVRFERGSGLGEPMPKH
jgi:membrane protein